MRAKIGLALVLLMLLAAPAGQAALHDRNCLDNNPGGDAGNARSSASDIGDDALEAECTGEMLLGQDDADWYAIGTDETLHKTAIEVTVCPDNTKTAPWETSIEVWTGFNPIGVVGVIQSDHVGALFPAEEIGSSADPGCDTVTVDGQLFTGQQIFVGVLGDSGDGLYTMSVRLS